MDTPTKAKCIQAYDRCKKNTLKEQKYNFMFELALAASSDGVSAESHVAAACSSKVERSAADFNRQHKVYYQEGELYGFPVDDDEDEAAGRPSSAQQLGGETFREQQQTVGAQAARQLSSPLQQPPPANGLKVLHRSTVLEVAMEEAIALYSRQQLNSKKFQQLRNKYLGMPGVWLAEVYKYVLQAAQSSTGNADYLQYAVSLQCSSSAAAALMVTAAQAPLFVASCRCT
jgi:hypothetical protein